ncbi:MAG TPA: peptidase M48 Ste24p, partial [Luteimonas sp.]|nr:peptidase M48 Ste24p [Luteimonas sp.]
FSGLFATHPPILKRIQALEPQFRADQLDELQRRWLVSPPSGVDEDARLGLDDARVGKLPVDGAQFAVTPPMVVAQVAQPASNDYRRADAIVCAIPQGLRALAAQRETVMSLVLALLLDDAPAIAARQHAEIAARLGAPVAADAQTVHDGALAGLHPMLRLPLAALAFPVLRLRPRPELDVFMDTVHAVVHADDQVSLFEYCLGRLLQTQLRESLDPARYARLGRRKLSDVRSEISALLCVVAEAGSASADDARRAYIAGIQRILPSDHLPYLPRPDVVQALDPVWEPLDALDPLAKQALIESITAAISLDNQVTIAESELLRTICAVLHCPLPPMLECV